MYDVIKVESTEVEMFIYLKKGVVWFLEYEFFFFYKLGREEWD